MIVHSTTCILPCSECGGEGRIWKSRHGGNDPDIRCVGECEACDGSGNEACSARGCGEWAVARNDDREPLCRICMDEWMKEQAA